MWIDQGSANGGTSGLCGRPTCRQGDKDGAVQGRRATLKAELASKEEKLKRLYRAIEDGLVDLDSA
jgi:hypothetical protein